MTGLAGGTVHGGAERDAEVLAQLQVALHPGHAYLFVVVGRLRPGEGEPGVDVEQIEVVGNPDSEDCPGDALLALQPIDHHLGLAGRVGPDGDEHLALGREVGVERCPRDVGDPGDLVDRRAGVAACQENVAGGVDDAGDRALGARPESVGGLAK